jgi:hypothetical protein
MFGHTMDNLDNVYTLQGFFYGYIMNPQHEQLTKI